MQAVLTVYTGFSCCKVPQCNTADTFEKQKRQRKEQLTDPSCFKGNWTTVNWLVWKYLYSKTSLPFCSWTVCKASWNSLQWASGLENLELSQFFHQCWLPSGKPAAIFLSWTSPRQDGQQLCALILGSTGNCVITVTTKTSIAISTYRGDMELLLSCLLGTWVDGCCAKNFWCSNSQCLMLLLSV